MRGRWEDADEDISIGVLFCRPDAPTEYYEDIFDLEARIAEDLGFEVRFIDIDLVAHDQCEEALEELPRGRGRCWVLRSWMLSAEEYASLIPPREDSRLRRSSFLGGLSVPSGHGAPTPPVFVRRTQPGFV